MATSVTFNGSVYTVPAIGDQAWASNVSAYLIAISCGCLQKTGGSFTLTGAIDFGATYGITAVTCKTRNTKFVGGTAGMYASLTAASISAGDHVVVYDSISSATDITISANDCLIEFMPGVKLTFTGGTNGLVVSGSRVILDKVWLEGNFAGTLTSLVQMTGTEITMRQCYLTANNAGLTVTEAVNMSAASSRCYADFTEYAVTGAIGLKVLNSGTYNAYSIRGSDT